MSSRHGLFKNILSLGIVQVANLVLPLISIPIISRIIGPDKFGVVNYAATFIGYFTLLIDYGFNFTATRKVSKDPDNRELRNIVFSEVLLAKTFLFFCSIILFIISLYTIEPLTLEKKVAVFTFLTCIASVLTQNWFFQAVQDLSKVAMFNLLSKLLFTILVLVIVHQKSDYIWMPLITSGVAILVALISYYWGINKYKLKLIFIPFNRIFKVLNEEKIIFLSTVVISLYTTTNIVILGLLQTNEQVGYYTAAQKLMLIATGVINMPLAQAFYPYIGKSFGENRDQGIKAVHKMLPLVVFFTGLAGIGMFIFAPLAIRILYGEAFLSSIPIFRILSFIPLIVGLSNIFGIQIMLNLKMDRIFFAITAGGAVLGIVLNILMIKWLGYIGTAWNWILVECYITLSMYIVLKKKNLNLVDWKQFKISEIRQYYSFIINKIKKGNG